MAREISDVEKMLTRHAEKRHRGLKIEDCYNLGCRVCTFVWDLSDIRYNITYAMYTNLFLTISGELFFELLYVEDVLFLRNQVLKISFIESGNITVANTMD